MIIFTPIRKNDHLNEYLYILMIMNVFKYTRDNNQLNPIRNNDYL